MDIDELIFKTGSSEVICDIRILLHTYNYIHCKPKPCKAHRELPVSQFPQENICFHYRESLFSLQGSCIHYRDFPVRITTQGDPCSHYREWVCSVNAIKTRIHRKA